MLSRLFKYDNYAIYKKIKSMLLVMLAIGVIFSLVCPLLIYLSTNAVSSRLSGILSGTLTSALTLMGIAYVFVFPIMICINIFKCYGDNTFTDRGYLTFTLPAKTNTILFSKWLSTVLWETVYFILALVIAALSGLVIWLITQTFMDLSSISTIITEAFRQLLRILPEFSLLSILALAVSYLVLPTSIIFAVTFACLIAKKRGMTIVVLLVLSQAISILEGIILVAFAFISGSTGGAGFADVEGIATLSQVVSLIVNAAVCALLYFFTAKMLDKKLSLQ